MLVHGIMPPPGAVPADTRLGNHPNVRKHHPSGSPGVEISRWNAPGGSSTRAYLGAQITTKFGLSAPAPSLILINEACPRGNVEGETQKTGRLEKHLYRLQCRFFRLFIMSSSVE